MYVALAIESFGSWNSLVGYGGLGDSEIEDSDEEATEEEVTAIALMKTSKQCMTRNLYKWKRC